MKYTSNPWHTVLLLIGALTCLCMAPLSTAATIDLTFYEGYWGGQKPGAGKIELPMPNFLLLQKGVNAPPSTYIADNPPILESQDVVAIKAVAISRPPFGGSLLKIKLTPTGKQKIERWSKKHGESEDSNERNYIFASAGKIRLLSLVPPWVLDDTLYLPTSDMSEALMLEQAFTR